MNKELIKNFDFKPLGAAIKAARERHGWTREYLAEMLDITAYHLKTIENAGKNPGFQLFFKLVTLFGISVDEYFFPTEESKKTSLRLQVDMLLDDCEEDALYIVKSTVGGIAEARAKHKGK
ncbi:MAG: helix-turn-helix domain-containing protein [Clostridiales Family XIII bacterium]|nr:helix-turn-helix domain-containing protein [Clostridiales Family XIII bacterium]